MSDKPEYIAFKPWIGDNYYKEGFKGKRILILGESHYQWDPEIPLTEELTIKCVQDQINGELKKQFWTNIVSVFNDKYSTLDYTQKKNETVKFWQSVSFYNYIQFNVGMGARIRPTPEMWEKSEKAFLNLIEEISPDRIIVLGFQLWRNMSPSGHEGEVMKGADQKETWIYTTSKNKQILAYAIKHPSAGFSSEYWSKYVAKAIDMSL